MDPFDPFKLYERSDDAGVMLEDIAALSAADWQFAEMNLNASHP